MKFAFVIPWFGEDIGGGAEAACRDTALQLHKAGLQIEILSTCIKSFTSDWAANHHSPGVEHWRGIPVRRFPVLKRYMARFDGVNSRLMNGYKISDLEEEWFLDEMVKCPALYEYMRKHKDEYVYMPIPYMFTTSVRGTAAAPDRTLLVPCLHDEAYAYLGPYRKMFREARGALYFTHAERAIANTIYGMKSDSGIVVGGGIDVDFKGDGDRFKAKYNLSKYVLYAGRKDAGKNVPQLIDWFCTYKEIFGGDLKLVLIGGGKIEIPSEAMGRDVLDLGFVELQDKHDAYAGAVALCQPSLCESFSLVMLEAWAAGTPVIVHENCAVTVDHCRRSQGGLYYRSFQDFVSVLEYMTSHSEVPRRLGANGARYVRENYTWARTVENYISAFRQMGFEP